MHQPAHQLGDVIVNIECTYTPDRCSASIDHLNNNYETVELLDFVVVRGRGMRRGISRRFETKTMKKCRARIRRVSKEKREKETRDGVRVCKTERREERRTIGG